MRLPAWSLDGSRIAFIPKRDGNAEIYVMSADDSGVSEKAEGTGWCPPLLLLPLCSARLL